MAAVPATVHESIAHVAGIHAENNKPLGVSWDLPFPKGTPVAPRPGNPRPKPPKKLAI